MYVHEAYQAETEASGSETEAIVNRFEARPRRSSRSASMGASVASDA